MDDLFSQFKAIVADPALKDTEIRRYIAWGKGNLEHALNYYYRKKEKQDTSLASQEKEARKESKEKDVFAKMKNASIRQKQTENFIKHVKEEYQLPIISRHSKEREKV
jgi:hypothetical protein